MTGSLRRACAEVGAPIGLVLEGGYAVDALAGSMAALMPVLGAAGPPEAEELPPHPLAVDAGERLARFWPAQFGTMRRM
jgi:acetoin utilization deacetylase AcuC-like enzyme